MKCLTSDQSDGYIAARFEVNEHKLFTINTYLDSKQRRITPFVTKIIAKTATSSGFSQNID